MGTNSESSSTVVIAEVPQAEILEYTMELRSLTRGSGKFVAEFIGYEEVPAMLAEKVIKQANE